MGGNTVASLGFQFQICVVQDQLACNLDADVLSRKESGISWSDRGGWLPMS